MTHRNPESSRPRELGEGLRLLSVRDLAEVFAVTEDAIRKRIRLRQLGPVIRQGRGYVMRAEALRRYLEDAERAWGRPSRAASPA